MRHDYWAVREGITQTATEIIALKAYGNLATASINTSDSFHYVATIINWKMGKAEAHYRTRKRDKHAMRWIRRHRNGAV